MVAIHKSLLGQLAQPRKALEDPNNFRAVAVADYHPVLEDRPPLSMLQECVAVPLA